MVSWRRPIPHPVGLGGTPTHGSYCPLTRVELTFRGLTALKPRVLSPPGPLLNTIPCRSLPSADGDLASSGLTCTPACAGVTTRVIFIS